jgi:aminoglycoside 3-N-acetyltransferase
VAAIGADALSLTRDHWLSITPCDELSPYWKLAQLPDGYILLIGVSHQSSTIFHCIEEMVGVDYHMQPGFARAKLIVNGQETYRRYMLHRYGAARDFNVMEDVFIERGIQRSMQIGSSITRLVKAREMVQLTVRSLTADPGILCQR